MGNKASSCSEELCYSQWSPDKDLEEEDNDCWKFAHGLVSLFSEKSHKGLMLCVTVLTHRFQPWSFCVRARNRICCACANAKLSVILCSKKESGRG